MAILYVGILMLFSITLDIQVMFDKIMGLPFYINNINILMIIADVPCSCDGTLRKSVDIWKNWQVNGGIHMHKLQLAIIKNALRV